MDRLRPTFFLVDTFKSILIYCSTFHIYLLYIYCICCMHYKHGIGKYNPLNCGVIVLNKALDNQWFTKNIYLIKIIINTRSKRTRTSRTFFLSIIIINQCFGFNNVYTYYFNLYYDTYMRQRRHLFIDRSHQINDIVGYVNYS